MSQASSACNFWKTEVLRLTKEVKRMAGELSHYPSVLLPPSGIYYSHPCTPTEKVDSPFQPLRPAESHPRVHVPSTSTGLSDTRSVTDESTSKRKDAEKFEFQSWPQASKFNSWKVCFRREVTTRSTHPRLSSDWLAEMDLASTKDELDLSGFIFDKHQSELENLNSKTAKGNHEDYSDRSQEKDQFLGGGSVQKRTSNAYRSE